MRRRAWVGLGSNLGERQRRLDDAALGLDRYRGIRVLARSSIYETAPWGDHDQPPFLNAVLLLDTAMGAHALLDVLLAIEDEMGRERDGRRWGPRVIDLDLLLMDDLVIDDERLVLPHPRLAQRAFVLAPLAEISPRLHIPAIGRVEDLLEARGVDGVEPLSRPGWPSRQK